MYLLSLVHWFDPPRHRARVENLITITNMNRKTTALIKDLELQIDYLVGYTPQGNHWKREYHLRQDMIDLALSDSQTPPEVIQKINTILESLYRIRNKNNHDQGYLKYAEFESKPTHKALVNDYLAEQQYYIEL